MNINSKDIYNYIDENLTPINERKQKNSEVFTSIEVIEEMMDKLEQSIWKNPNFKWLDPCAGMGNFMIVIYNRLINGLSKVIPNIEERRKWILEKMLYMVEYNKENANKIYRLFNGNRYKINLFVGSFINGERYIREGVDIFSLNPNDIQKFRNKNNIRFCKSINDFGGKFYITVANPPFNDENKISPIPIYDDFIKKSLEITSRYLLFITPSKWFASGRGLDDFRKMMLNRTDIKFINHFDNARTLFKENVDLSGGVNYFLIDKNYKGLCNVNNQMIKLNKYDILITDKKYYNIIDRMMQYPSITLLYNSKGSYGIVSNDKKLSNTKINNNYVKCYVSQQKGNIKYIDKRLIKNNIPRWKVITPCASNTKRGFGRIFITKPNEVNSASFITFIVNNENEAKSLLSYLNTRLPNFMLRLRKNTQNISRITIEWVPLPPLDRIWDDNKVIKYYKLNQDDIKLLF